MGRNKRIYVLFDYPADMLTFSEIKSKCMAEDCRNYFYTMDCSVDERDIHDKMYRAIMSASLVLIIVDSNSKYLGGMYDLGIEIAIKSDKPLVIVNMNHKRSLDIENCPMNLRDRFALHISCDPSIINFAIQVWPQYYEENKGNDFHSMYLEDTIYRHFNL